MIILLILLLLVFPVYANENVNILCPKCHKVMFKCDVDNLFSAGGIDASKHCKPANSDILPMVEGGKKEPLCPYDGTRWAFKSDKQTTMKKIKHFFVGGGLTSDKGNFVYTNKGWMPPKKYIKDYCFECKEFEEKEF